MDTNAVHLALGEIELNRVYLELDGRSIMFFIANREDVPARARFGLFRVVPADQFATYIPMNKIAVKE